VPKVLLGVGVRSAGSGVRTKANDNVMKTSTKTVEKGGKRYLHKRITTLAKEFVHCTQSKRVASLLTIDNNTEGIHFKNKDFTEFQKDPMCQEIKRTHFANGRKNSQENIT